MFQDSWCDEWWNSRKHAIPSATPTSGDGNLRITIVIKADSKIGFHFIDEILFKWLVLKNKKPLTYLQKMEELLELKNLILKGEVQQLYYW